ncbi:hypothetical protein Nepgr_019367 [Nepenthes gracilis]|uniref:Uncharacterized protein n=1 Tax=Nepenthes gracilis TaxID=150966 RepID=A0AAD3SX00_NEPGR|nr:hypothetical protein Nepgr_019367 [Nepenthes gracilis]
MSWWQKMVFPLRRAWLSLSSHFKTPKINGDGLLKLHEDVETCGYEDVQVMWEMLRGSELQSSSSSKRKQRPSWRIF